MRVTDLGGAVGGHGGRFGRAVALSGLVLALVSGCGSDRSLDWDLRNNDSSTAGAVERHTGARPEPDARGVISYPGYQVAVARRGDTVTALAERIGLPAAQLAAFNALKPENPLRAGEVLALPVRVAASTAAAALPGAVTPTALDVSTIATTALDRVQGASPAANVPFTSDTSGPVPVRYQVKRGETAFTIARQFDISAKALADWNGLSPDLAVREGQYLIIPTAEDAARQPTPAVDATLPGQGSPLPEPPSASQPLPDEETPTAAQVAATLPASPDLSTERTASSAAQFAMPVDGSVTRGYKKKVQRRHRHRRQRRGLDQGGSRRGRGGRDQGPVGQPDPGAEAFGRALDGLYRNFQHFGGPGGIGHPRPGHCQGRRRIGAFRGASGARVGRSAALPAVTIFLRKIRGVTGIRRGFFAEKSCSLVACRRQRFFCEKSG